MPNTICVLKIRFFLLLLTFTKFLFSIITSKYSYDLKYLRESICLTFWIPIIKLKISTVTHATIFFPKTFWHEKYIYLHKITLNYRFFFSLKCELIFFHVSFRLQHHHPFSSILTPVADVYFHRRATCEKPTKHTDTLIHTE